MSVATMIKIILQTYHLLPATASKSEKENVVDALTSAATAVVKLLQPKQVRSSPSTRNSKTTRQSMYVPHVKLMQLRRSCWQKNDLSLSCLETHNMHVSIVMAVITSSLYHENLCFLIILGSASIISSMCKPLHISGHLDCCTNLSTVTGPEFEEFVQQSLASVTKPFDGVNSNGVVVLDNASIHHVDEVVQAIPTTGATILLPYSPDLNPAEKSFSKVKSIMKANEETFCYVDTQTAVLTAFNAITSHDCIEIAAIGDTYWLHHSHSQGH